MVEIKFYKCNFKYQTQVITYRTLKKCTRNFISKYISQNSYSIICLKCLLYNNNSHCITHFKKVSVYRSLNCLSQDLSVLLSGKGLPQKKRNNISPGAPSGSCLSFISFLSIRKGTEGGEIRGNEWEKRNSIDRENGSKELPMCHWSKWNHRRTFSSATTMRMPITQKGSKSAGNSCRCFLFVFPSSEVIDEHLGPMSVKAYRVCLAQNFFRSMLWILSIRDGRQQARRSLAINNCNTNK